MNKRRLKFGRSSAGFGLIELMITMVIVAILASIALPSFVEQLRKSRRGEAKAALTQIAAMQESYRTEMNRYTADLTQLGFPAAGWNQTENGYYQVSVLAPNAGCPIATCFQLTAQVVAGSAQEDDEWTFELWSDGRKRRIGDAAVWELDWKK
jgi:type IV pilus assembly protein PilE